MIPYGKQSIDQQDIEAVINALKGEYLTQGPLILEFEKKFAAYVGAKYAVAVANGTAALHLSTLSLNIQKGDKVITTPITFAASANCVKYCGADIIFADIDPETFLIDLEQVRKILEKEPAGAIKGIIAVDFAGRAVHLEELRKIADEFGCFIIEDACHAPGGYFINSLGIKENCGNGNYADLAVFSFHPVKHIASGEGGMITTNSEKLYQKLLKLRTHGITRNSGEYILSPSFACGKEGETEYPAWYMEMQELGYNYRLTDFQAALGISQLAKADSGLDRRKQIAAKYDIAFKNVKGLHRQSGLVEGHAYHLYILQIEKRKELYYYLRSKEIYAQIHYIPCHLMPYYREQGWSEGSLPRAEEYYKGCISLPMYPTLTEDEQDFVINTILEFYN